VIINNLSVKNTIEFNKFKSSVTIFANQKLIDKIKYTYKSLFNKVILTGILNVVKKYYTVIARSSAERRNNPVTILSVHSYGIASSFSV